MICYSLLSVTIVQMKLIYSLQIFAIFISFITSSSCWQFFTSVKDFTLTNSDPEQMSLHSEYFYGHCAERKNLKFYHHLHFDHMDILGKIIIRGWLDFYRIPTCIVLRARSHEYDLMRSTSYNFQICVPRITYCHSQRRFKYFYYEWYIPSDYVGGMNWDMYFYGPESAAWQ